MLGEVRQQQLVDRVGFTHTCVDKTAFSRALRKSAHET